MIDASGSGRSVAQPTNEVDCVKFTRVEFGTNGPIAQLFIKETVGDGHTLDIQASLEGPDEFDGLGMDT